MIDPIVSQDDDDDDDADDRDNDKQRNGIGCVCVSWGPRDISNCLCVTFAGHICE